MTTVHTKDVEAIKKIIEPLCEGNYAALVKSGKFGAGLISQLKENLVVVRGDVGFLYHLVFGEVIMSIDTDGFVYYNTYTRDYEKAQDYKSKVLPPIMLAHIDFDGLVVLNFIWNLVETK